jgi:hypothetical protein
MSRARELLAFDIDAGGKPIGMNEIASAIEKAGEIVCDEQAGWVASHASGKTHETPFMSLLTNDAANSFKGTVSSSMLASNCPTLQAYGACVSNDRRIGGAVDEVDDPAEKAMTMTRQIRLELNADGRRIGMFGAILNEMTRFN